LFPTCFRNSKTSHNMPATLTQSAFDQQSFEEFLHARKEPAWSIQQRREAWQSFCEKDWPQRSEEEWIRTDIRLFKLNQYSLPTSGGSEGASPSQGSVAQA